MAIFIFIFSFLSFPEAGDQEPLHLSKKERKFVESIFPAETNVTVLDLDAKNLEDYEDYRAGDRVFLLGQQDQPVGYLLSTRAMGRYEYFDYLVAFDPEFIVQEVMVTTYRSSHGAAICQKKWLRQFAGYSGEELSLGKDIDSVSGATISAGSMVKDMGRCHSLMQSLRELGIFSD